MTRTWKRRLQKNAKRAARAPRPLARPWLEALETRTLPSVSILNNNGNGYAALHFAQTQGYYPPDTCGAAGPSGYVETVNQTVAIYTPRDTGASSVMDTFSHFLYTVGGLTRTDGGSELSDPIVVYDDQIGRFIVGDQDVDFNTHVSNFDIAVSKTDTPTTLSTADWNFCSFSTTEATYDADYPGNFGYNHDAFVFTLNMFPNANQNYHTLIVSVSIADLVSGAANPAVFRNDFAGFSLRPTVMHDSVANDPMWFVTEHGSDNTIDVIRMTNVLSNSSGFLTTNFSGLNHLPVVDPLNPNGSVITDNIDGRFIKAAESNGRLVASHCVGLINADAADWFEFDVSSGLPTFSDQGRVLATPGVYVPGTYVIYPSIDINSTGQIGMTYMKSGTDSGTDFLSMWVTGRTPNDPLGTMETPVEVPAGTGLANYNANGRAGDLSGINVDPSDGSFWAANEFATNPTADSLNWGTAVAHFNVLSRTFSVVPSTSNPVAGLAFSLTVSALDLQGHVDPTYRGTVHFASSDGHATLPADYTFTADDAGVHTFAGVILRSAGARSITVSDGSGVTGEADLTVSAAALDHLDVSGNSANQVVGRPFNLTVRAVDPFENTVTSFGGTLHFTSTDGNAILPPDYTFQPSDNGVHTFANGATFLTQGMQSITATDAADSVSGSAQFQVSFQLDHFQVVTSLGSADATAGVPFSITVTAQDSGGRTVNTYTGTVHFLSSDGSATLPPDYRFQANELGVHTFTGVILRHSGQQTITARDQANTAISGIATVTVDPAAAAAARLTNPSAAVAGTAFSLTVQVVDQFNNVATGYRGTTSFRSSDTQADLPGGYNWTAADSGMHTFTITLKTAGPQTVTVSDSMDAFSATTNPPIAVSPGAFTTLLVQAPASAYPNQAFSLTVRAQDSYGNNIPSYAGLVHFASSDGAAVLPADYAFVSADQGVHTFTVTLRTAGVQTVTVSDAGHGVSGQATIGVSQPAAALQVVASVSEITAGSPLSVTVTAVDGQNNVQTGYLGTVHFTSTDLQAVLPNDYTFTVADQGVHTFAGVALKTAGGQTLTVNDAINTSVFGSASVLVNAAAFSTFGVSVPATATAGVAFGFTVAAQDAYCNTITGYTGTVGFGSSDGSAALPGNYAFVAGDHGVHTFSATLFTAGAQSITATDQAPPHIFGTGNLTVNPAPAASFQVATSGNATAGVAQNLTIVALDGFHNVVTFYGGTVHFTSSDGQAVLPGNYTFVSGDAGTHTFVGGLTLKTAGSQTVSAAEVGGTATGSAAVQVSAAAFSTFGIAAPAGSVAGVSFSVTVTAQDVYHNTITGYAGTVSFSSSDGQAVLPGGYTFSGGDAGAHTFSGVVLKTAGNQTVTVTDQVAQVVKSTTVAVSAAAASSLRLTASASAVQAGNPLTLTVAALDPYGNVVTAFADAVHFSSSDVQAVLPADYSFVGGDHGVHTFTNGLTLKTAGGQTVTATDKAAPALHAQVTIEVSAAAPTQMILTGPTTATAGDSLGFTVRVEDFYGNTVVSYAQTVTFTSTDGTPNPPSYTFTAGDAGVHTFTNLVTVTHAGVQTLRVDDGQLLATLNVTVSPAAFSRLAVSAPASVAAGATFSVTVTAQDKYLNTIMGYGGTVHFTSSDFAATLPADYAFAAGDHGVHTFAGVVLRSSNAQTVTAADLDASVSGQAALTVTGSAATHFLVGAASAVVAGVPLDVTVTALDSSNHVVTGYLGTVHFTSSDGQAMLPADYTFTAGDAGVHTFAAGAILKSAGSRLVTVADAAAPVVQGSASVTVSPSSPREFLVAGPAQTGAGQVFSVTVTVADTYGNATGGYTGMVHLLSTDGQATLPANYTFVAGDQGVHTFTGLVLGTAGAQTVFAVDPGATFVTGQLGVQVTPGAASHLRLEAPAFGFLGTPFAVTVTALDDFQNAATGYTGTVHFTSSDGAASLPGDYHFGAGDQGVHTFSVALAKVGAQLVRAADTVTASIAGSATVKGVATTHFRLGAPFSSKSGDTFAVTLTALNAAGATDVSFTGTVHFTSSDPLAGLPADYTFVAGDQGIHTFAVTLRGIGRRAVTAADTLTGASGAGTVLVYADLIATGADLGGGPEVVVFDAATGVRKFDFFAYAPGFFGGVRVALADVTGDGIPDILTGPGPTGGPETRIYDGVSGKLVADFMAFDAHFLGGEFVAGGDFNHDGYADVVAGADAGGGPHVIVYSGRDLIAGKKTVLASFYAYSPATFTGGVRLAVGDVNGDGTPDVITTPGAGLAPEVRVFDGTHLANAGRNRDIIRDFLAYDASFTGGVTVAVGDANSDGVADIITGKGPGSLARVKVFSGKDSSLLQNFLAYDASFTGGVRVGAADLNGDGKADLLTAPGAGSTPLVTARDATTLTVLDSFYAYNPAFQDGVFVGGV